MTDRTSRTAAQQAESIPQLLLRSREAAKTLGCSEKTLWLQSHPRGPIPTVKIGDKLVRYALADLQAWIASQRQSA